LLSIVFAIGYQIWNRKKSKSSSDFERLEDIDRKLEGFKKSTEKSLGSLGLGSKKDLDASSFKGNYSKSAFDDDDGMEIPKRKKY
jgi:hypothetical protein